MIRMIITDELHLPNHHYQVAKIQLTEDPKGSNDELVAYDVKIVIDRGPAVGIYHRRIEDWPKNAINYLGLLKAVLSKLDDEQIAIEESDDNSRHSDEGDATPGPSALAWKVRGTLPEI